MKRQLTRFFLLALLIGGVVAVPAYAQSTNPANPRLPNPAAGPPGQLPPDVQPCSDSDDTCGVHFVFYGVQPHAVYAIVDPFDPDSDTGVAGSIVCQPPATLGGPCEAYVQFPRKERVPLTIGSGGGDWPYPVRIDSPTTGCNATQSIKDIKARQLAHLNLASGGDPNDFALTCVMNLDPAYTSVLNPGGGILTVTAYWRGDLEGSGGPQCPLDSKDPAGYHYYNVVDFPSPKNYAYPGYNAGDVTYYTCGAPGPNFQGRKPWPPDDPYADAEG